MDKRKSTSSIYANKIYERAVTLQYSIGDLEKKCGYSAGYISRCRKGNCRLSIDAVKDICDELGCKISDFENDV